jgi:hypothetical protein
MAILADLANQVVAIEAEHLAGIATSDGWNDRALSEIYRLLDVVGHRNLHLSNPLNLDPTIPYFRERLRPLTGQEPVYGRFLLLDYSDHEPAMILSDHDDVTDLERRILSNGGVLNCWTTWEIAFVDFVATPYQVAYTRRDNTPAVFHMFDNIEGRTRLLDEFHSPRVQWLHTT